MREALTCSATQIARWCNSLPFLCGNASRRLNLHRLRHTYSLAFSATHALVMWLSLACVITFRNSRAAVTQSGSIWRCGAALILSCISFSRSVTLFLVVFLFSYHILIFSIIFWAYFLTFDGTCIIQQKASHSHPQYDSEPYFTHTTPHHTTPHHTTPRYPKAPM